jgi:hypothetical protein
MTSKDAVFRFLENRRIERAEDYVKRGRALEKLGEVELEQRFVAAYRRLAAEPANAETRRLTDDIDAEYLLRGKELPYGLVSTELEAFTAAANAVIQKLRGDPVELDRVNRELEDDIEAFEEEHRRSPKN